MPTIEVDNLDNPLQKPLLQGPKLDPDDDEKHAFSHGPHGIKNSAHEHSHEEDLVSASAQRRLRWAVYLASFFMITEIVGGLIANSLAIITDAAHMMSDVGGFLVSMLSLSIISRKATRKYSFGYHQAEVLGALISILIVWLLTGMLLLQALKRFENLEPIDGKLMCALAVLGLIVNLALMKTLGHNHSHGGGGGGGGGHGHSHGDIACSHGSVHGLGSKLAEDTKSAIIRKKTKELLLSGSINSPRSDEGGQKKKIYFDRIDADHPHGHAHDNGGRHAHDEGKDKKHDHHHHGPPEGGGKMEKHVSMDHARATSHTIVEIELDEEEEESLAMKAAMAHVIGDIVQSIGVIVASLLIWLEPMDVGVTSNGISNWNYADPLSTVLFAFLVMLTTKQTFVGIYQSLMFRTPDKYPSAVVSQHLMRIPDVKGAHDIHIWEVGRNPVCSAHVTVDKAADMTKVLVACLDVIREKFEIEHTTIQIELEDEFDHAAEKYGRLHDHEFCCN